MLDDTSLRQRGELVDDELPVNASRGNEGLVERESDRFDRILVACEDRCRGSDKEEKQESGGSDDRKHE